jgi:hypothetical protein
MEDRYNAVYHFNNLRNTVTDEREMSEAEVYNHVETLQNWKCGSDSNTIPFIMLDGDGDMTAINLNNVNFVEFRRVVDAVPEYDLSSTLVDPFADSAHDASEIIEVDAQDADAQDAE